MPEFPDFAALAAAVADFALPSPAELDDAQLLDAQRTLGGIGRSIDAMAATIAGEIAHRSRRELGHSGLAQRLGARTPEKLVQHLTGSSAGETRALIRVGALMATRGSDTPPPSPWLVDVAAAVSAGTLSLAAADAIRLGLGAPTDATAAAGAVTSDQLLAAARSLLQHAPSLTVEALAIAARDARADLDLDRIADQEAALRELRYLHLIPQANGMTRISGMLDPESAAHVVAAVDAATAPRRGGPRFVDPDEVAAVDELNADARTTEQIALDTLVELVRMGTAVDDGAVLGSRRPVVQLHVTDRDLRERRGIARYDGQSSPISIRTAEREVCATGVVPIRFDDGGAALDVGRDQRTFTQRQRIALAARDGGCRFPGCERPPSWTEAHHITAWSRGGRTDVADGILLCQHHHLMVHNNGWRVTRARADYWLTPPPTIDPDQRSIAMPTKSRVLRRALAAG